jgi:hypothetical protein
MWTDKKMQLHVRMETIEMNVRKEGKDKRKEEKYKIKKRMEDK